MQYDSIFDDDGQAYFDYNPAHAIWYLLVQSGFPENRINEESFLAAAITLYGEDRGISARLNASIDIKSIIMQILAHANGILTWGTDGKFHLLLIRDDYVVEDLPVVNEQVLLEHPIIERAAWPETYGEIQVQYNKRVYPPAGIRYYQEAVEVVRKGRPYIRNYQEVVEVVRKGRAFIRWYQQAEEVVHANSYACLDDIAILWSDTTTTTTTV